MAGACSNPGSTLALEAGVVRIEIDGQGRGTGIAIDHVGHVVTSFTGISGAWGDAAKIAVIETAPQAGSRRAVDYIEWTSEDLNLAILQVAALQQPPARLQEHEPQAGDTVYTVGFPGLPWEESAAPFSAPTVREGQVVRLIAADREAAAGHRWGGRQPVVGAAGVPIIVHTAPVGPSDAGGPLVNGCGDVVGIEMPGGFFDDAGRAGGAAGPGDARPAGFALHVAALIPELRERNIAFIPAAEACGASSPLMLYVAVGGGAGLLGIAAVILALRRPRQRVVGTVAGGGTDRRARARNARRPGTPHAAASRPITDPGLGWVLSGFGHDGRAIRVSFRDVGSARTGDMLTIGRDPALCQIVIDDETVSGVHARLQARPAPRSGAPTLFVEDLGSTNGTVVDGKPVPGPFKPVPLPIGATLRLGDCNLKLSSG